MEDNQASVNSPCDGVSVEQQDVSVEQQDAAVSLETEKEENQIMHEVHGSKEPNDTENQDQSGHGDALDMEKPDANGGNEAAEADDDHEEIEEDDVDDDPLEKLIEPLGKEQLSVIVQRAVEAHPDLMGTVREIADAEPAHRKIFVFGFGWDTTVETLKAKFGKYGEIDDCRLVLDRVSKKPKGYAFILFKHRSGARKALKQPNKKIGNRLTTSQLAITGPSPPPAPTPPPQPPMSEYTQRKIFVSNVSADIEPEKLLEFFKQFGEIEEGPLGLDKKTGKPKGFALFVFKTIESARKALEQPHRNFEGKMLHCQQAIDGPKPGKHGYGVSGFSGYPQHYPPSHFYPPAKKSKYSSAAPVPRNLIPPVAPVPPSFGSPAQAQGLNPLLAQALTALLATQGAAGMGLGNLLGNLGDSLGNQGGAPTAQQSGRGASTQMGQSNAGRS